MDELVGFVVTAIVFCLVATAVVMFAIYLPIIGLAIGLIALPGVVYYAHINSPGYKEKVAKAQTETLYRHAKALAPPDWEKLSERLNWDTPAVAHTAMAISQLEGYSTPKAPPPICNSIEAARYRDGLHRYIEKASALEDYDDFLNALFSCLPRYEQSKGMFEATAEMTNEEVEKLALSFFADDRFFHNLRVKLDKNYAEQGVMPSEYQGDNCAYDYFKDTPLIHLASIPKRVSLNNLNNHMWVVAGSGHGKTSLIKYMVSKHLAEDCTIVVMDSHRQLIDELVRLDLPLDDVTYISPHNNLGINLFDVDYQNLRKDEGAVTNAVELLEYVLGALMEAELTSKQQVVFQFAILLTIAAEGNIDTFLEILKPKGWVEYADVVDEMPKHVQEFFHNDFDKESEYGATKKEVRRRVFGMIRSPTFDRIFSADDNPIDLADEFREAKLILIDTDQFFLGESGSSFFGRLFIAMTLQTARQRFRGKHRRVYFYIDESPPYFDSRLERMLREARKADVGLLLFLQDLKPARDKDLLSALVGNTAIKFAGGLSDNDARYMAANMHTSYQFIKDQEKLSFAAYVEGQGVFSIKVPIGVFDNVPKRNDLKELIAVMEEDMGIDPPEADHDDDPELDDDIKPGKL